MPKQDFPRMATTIMVALLTSAACTSSTAAASQQLNCLLSDTPARSSSQDHSVAVVYDEDNKILTAEADGRHYRFGKVTITYIAISGQTDDVSVGIDRSSYGIVWQHYLADKVNTEYGHCRPAGASN